MGCTCGRYISIHNTQKYLRPTLLLLFDLTFEVISWPKALELNTTSFLSLCATHNTPVLFFWKTLAPLGTEGQGFRRTLIRSELRSSEDLSQDLVKIPGRQKLLLARAVGRSFLTANPFQIRSAAQSGSASTLARREERVDRAAAAAQTQRWLPLTWPK